MNRPPLKFRRLHPDAILPRTWSDGAVGYDLHAHTLTDTGRPNRTLIPPRTTRNVPTGLMVEAPQGFFLMVCSRSGLAARSLFVTNAPGIIDPDYRGEIRVLLYNGSHEAYYVDHQSRIAQLIAVPATYLEVQEAPELSITGRGERGFGSTGA